MANIQHPARTDDFFFPLDNSAVFIASITGKSYPFVFRLSCELDETIYLPDLEAALEAVASRYPFLKTELRPGVFWYYLEPLKKPVRVFADSRFPAERHRTERLGRYLFRVRVYNTRVSCEFHHILTDGTGALEFMKSLLAAYLTRRGVVCPDWEGIIHPESVPNPEEWLDAYADLSRPEVPLPDPLPAAFHLPGRRYHGQVYRVVNATLSVKEALQAARERNVSITELLAAVYLEALQAIQEAHSQSKYQPICIQIPVNMRRFYPSITLRNFFLFLPVSIDRRLGHFSFEEILSRVHYTLKLNLNTKELDRQIRRNVRGEKYFLSRIVPLFIKNIVLRILGKLLADKPLSGNLSNLQSVSMPEAFAKHIRRFDILPARRSVSGANIGMISWGDTLSLTVGSLVIDRSLERLFFSRCAELGLRVTVESNV